MVLFLLNIIFISLSTLSNLVFRLIFTTTAYLVVLTIQAFKVPGEAVKVGLEQFAEAIKWCVEYLFELALEATSSLVSAIFDAVKEGVSGSAAAAGEAIAGLAEQARNSLDGFLKDLPEVLEGFSEMVSTMVADLWNNYKAAVGYVTENA